jgi:hypothetical protein
MLIVDDKNMPSLLTAYCDENWEGDTTKNIQDVFLTIKKYLQEAKDNDERFIFLWIAKEGTAPSIPITMRIVAHLLSVRTLISESLNFTIVWANTDDAENDVNFILKFYTPSRPLHVVRKKEEVVKLCQSKQ